MSDHSTLYLVRDTACTDQGIYGELVIPEKKQGGHFLWHKIQTLERPWRSNRRSKSCVPSGKYPLRFQQWGNFYARYHSNWGHSWVCEIAEVPDRSAILIHRGTRIKDSQGCVLLGSRRTARGKKQERTLADSTQAYRRFYDLVDKLRKTNPDLWMEISVKDRPDACQV